MFFYLPGFKMQTRCRGVVSWRERRIAVHDGGPALDFSELVLDILLVFGEDACVEGDSGFVA
jgi:hypothetical protein